MVKSKQVKYVYAGFSRCRILPHNEYQRLLECHRYSSFYMVGVVRIDDFVHFIACTTEEYKGLGKMKEVNCFGSQHFNIEVTNIAIIFLCGMTVSI